MRLAFVVHGGLDRKDWRTLRVEDIGAEAAELEFLERLNGAGEIEPALLTDDVSPRWHPARRWKV